MAVSVQLRSLRALQAPCILGKMLKSLYGTVRAINTYEHLRPVEEEELAKPAHVHRSKSGL